MSSQWSIILTSEHTLIIVQRGPLISAVMWSPLIIGTLIFCIFMAPFYNHRFMPPKWMLVIAPIILAMGVVLISRNDVHTGYWQYTFSGSVVMSLGTAIFFIHYLNVAYAATPSEDQGLVSGIVQTSAQVATALGLAIGSSFLSANTPEALVPEYRNSFWVAVAFGGAGSLTALIFIKPIPPKAAVSKLKDVEKQDNGIESASVNLSTASDVTPENEVKTVT